MQIQGGRSADGPARASQPLERASVLSWGLRAGVLLQGWLWGMLGPAVRRGPGAGSRRPAALLWTLINNPALQGLGSSTARPEPLVKANGRMSQDL